MTKTIQKRCGRCDKLFGIPHVSKGGVFAEIIKYFPCTYCGYAEAKKPRDRNKRGRCGECSVPFTIIDHYAKGCCQRCYTNIHRKKALQN